MKGWIASEVGETEEMALWSVVILYFSDTPCGLS
jgi:hypothetical protein